MSISEVMRQRILLLDGAMGTQVQQHDLSEEDVRGSYFHNHTCSLKGNHDILCFSQPQLIQDIHMRYIAAGADIITTNTFGATRIGLSEYSLGHEARALNQQAASLAVAARTAQRQERPVWIAGSLGPTPKSASISNDVSDPGARTVDFHDLSSSYEDAAMGLIEGGVDVLLIETIFDILNGKAAIFGVRRAMEACKKSLPLLVSFTLTDLAGRTLSGQTTEAAMISLAHSDALAMGINCALGPKELDVYVAELSKILPTALLVYPNAGLPNALGGYDETPERFAKWIKEWGDAGYLNLVGGCCGTTPEHISALRDVVDTCRARKIPQRREALELAGLEPKILPTLEIGAG